jgi:integrase
MNWPQTVHRFEYKGQEYTGSSDLAATPQNMRDAGEIEMEALKALKQGKRPAAQIEVITFRNAVQKFLPWAKTEYRAHPSSCKRIMTSLSSALVFFNKHPVSAIDSAKVDDYKSWRAREHEVRDITIRHDLHALSVFFAYAIRHHWTMCNPIDEVNIPSDEDAERIHVITQEEQEEYFKRAHLNPNLHDVTRLMLNQGVRPEEAVELTKKDVDFETNKFFVSSGKTRAARRYLDMTSETKQIMECRMKGDSLWLFPSRKKPGSHIGRINSAHDRLVAKAAKAGVEIDFVPYDFRHTFATVAAQTGIDLSTLAALLGHASTRCVHKYVHPTADHKKMAMKRYDRKLMQAKKQAKRGTKR